MLHLEKADLESLIGVVGRKFADLHKSWLHAYRVWIGMEPKGVHPPADDLYDALETYSE